MGLAPRKLVLIIALLIDRIILLPEHLNQPLFVSSYLFAFEFVL